MCPAALAVNALAEEPPSRALPDHLAQAIWRGDALGAAPHTVIPSGHALLDAELPGGGWPCQAMSEILVAQSGQAEWRLLSPALARITRQGGSVLLIGPPCMPYLPGLFREGLRDDRLVCIEARTLAERLWATEQSLKARCVSAVLSWLPQVRAQDIRRLHACAAQHPGPFFVFRPLKAQADSSAAPLRLALSVGAHPHPLQVDIIKRRGPLLDRPVSLPHWPEGLAPLLPAFLPASRPPPLTRPAHGAPSLPPGASRTPDILPSKRPAPRTLFSPSASDGALPTPTHQHHHAALDSLAAGGSPRS